MSVAIFSQLKERAGRFAFNSGLYNWTLNSAFWHGGVPERLVVRPVDPWPGDADMGRQIFEQGFDVLRDDFYLHGFGWLRDLRSVAEKSCKIEALQNRAAARAMIAQWARIYKGWDAYAWRADIMGARLSMWISLYEFFCDGAGEESYDEDFEELFFSAMLRQSLHLSRALSASDLQGIALLEAAKGLLYAGLALEGREIWVDQALDILEVQADLQILRDGAHISQNSGQLLHALRVYTDVRSALQTGGYPLPETIQHTIDRMGPALRFFRYHDKRFALFNGAQEGDTAFVDRVLAQTGAKGKTPSSLPCAGYERVHIGRSLIMFDCGNMPERKFDQGAHAAPLAFEMCYGRERLFVNCGAHGSDPAWRDALRATAAHNTVTLDNRNACEIGVDGHITRRTQKVSVMREDADSGCLLEGVHDGYENLNGVVHTRRLYLSEDGHNLRGEDVLRSKTMPMRPIEAAARFHLHPLVNVSLINGGREALLRMQGGAGWRFRVSGGVLALEDSIYVGDSGNPRKTKQLAIYAQVIEQELKIKWGLQKEG